MKQINSDQIVDNGIPENTVKPMPRDLAASKTANADAGLSFINKGASNEQRTAPDGSSVPVAVPPPSTPSLVSIKSQTVKIKDDGTYAIDVIIDVEDIRGVSDYEVRISKSAGTI